MDDLERALLGGAGFVAVLALLIVVGIVGAVFSFSTWVAGGTAPVPAPYLISLWIPLVEQDAARYGIPPALDLGLIAHESGGNWLATREDPNGTVDAGLQQVNSSHWAADGLGQDPYDPAGNVAAGLGVLASALNSHPDNLSEGLEAYNGVAPGYAAAVFARVAATEQGPQVFAWPVESRIASGLFGFLGGGQYLAAASAGPSRAYLVANALCPCGQPYRWDGRSWTPLLPPRRLTITYQIAGSGPSQPEPLSAPGSAPADLRLLTPPGSSYYWAAIPVKPGAVTLIIVTATWTYPTGAGGQTTTTTRSASSSLAVELGGG